MAKKTLSKTKKFDSSNQMDKFLEESDLGDFFSNSEMSQSKRRKINVELPERLVEHLDLEASRAGVSRQPLIKIWLIQKLEEERRKRSA